MRKSGKVGIFCHGFTLARITSVLRGENKKVAAGKVCGG